MTSSVTPVTKEQLSHIIMVFTTTTDVAGEPIKKHMTDEFGKVKTHLNSLNDSILNKVPDETTLQRLG